MFSAYFTKNETRELPYYGLNIFISNLLTFAVITKTLHSDKLFPVKWLSASVWLITRNCVS